MKPFLLGLIAAAILYASYQTVPADDAVGVASAAGVAGIVVAMVAMGLGGSGSSVETAANTAFAAELEHTRKAADSREKTIEELKQRLVDNTTLRRTLAAIARLTVQSLEVERVIGQVIETVRSAPIRAQKAAVWLVQDGEMVLEACGGYGAELRPGSREPGEIVRYVASKGTFVDSDTIGRDPTLATLSRIRPTSFVCAPLVHNKELLGVLDIEEFKESGKEKTGLREDVDVIEFVASLTAMVIKNGRLFEEARLRAITDGLTRLYNHRYFQDQFDVELRKASESSRPVSVMITDIDHFKKFNDTYGHQIGDLVLAETASVFREMRREGDTVARYGGEEFAVILPSTTKAVAVKVADSLREAVAGRLFKSEKGDLKVNISVGVSTFPEDAREKSVLIKKADAALYRAKEDGRNRVCAAGVETLVEG